MARTVRETGVVKAWNPDRGFGFVQREGAPDLFLHIKAFPRGASDPAVGDEVTFAVETGPDGKPRAAQARLAEEPYVPPVRPTSPIIGALAILAFAAIYSLVEVYWGPVPIWVLFLYLGVSAITFGAYAIDKSAARMKQRRIAETSLILLGMLGGWPGAILAQQLLRHKTTKRTFRAVFWASVLINVFVFVALNAPGVAQSLAEVLGVIRPGFFRRIAALLIDYALILGWMAVIAAVSAGIALATGGYANWLAWGTAVAQLLGFAVLVLPVGIYLFVTESSSRQATVGKRVLKLRVVARDGSRAPAWRILVRTIVKLLPWEIAHFFVWHTVAAASGDGVFPPWLIVGLVVADILPVAYVLTVLLEPERRGPHDLVAGTRVVRVERPAV